MDARNEVETTRNYPGMNRGDPRWPDNLFPSVLWIRIRMDPELLPGSGIIVPDPDPGKSERAYK